jgi:hypothetical protein
MWDSDEERIGAFEELHKELEKLEEDTSNEHNYFPWKVIQPFINESSGSSITIETNTATPKNISSWINGTLKWSSDGSTLERGTGGSYHEKFVGKKAKYKVVHSTGSGALHIPHIKNEIKYKEVETVGDVEISSEEKKEEVHQPVPNNGGYILPFEKCLSTGELYELKILKPKDHGSDNPQSIQLMPNDKLQLPKLPQGHLRVKTLDGDKCKKAHPEKTHEEWLKSGVKGEKDSLGEMPKNIHKIKDKKTNEWRVLVKNDVKRIGHPDESSGNKNIFSHWNKLSDKQKKCMTLFTNTHLNLMRHNEDFAKLTGHKAYDPGSLTALGGHTLGTNNTQAHHPLHKYHKLQNFMNNEYEALNDLALNGGEEVLVKVSRIKEAFDTDQDERDQGNIKRIVTDPAILDDVKGRHAGQVWKEAVDSIYSYIRDSKHVSEIMKSAMMASLESISMLAVFRVVENLGHEKIGLGFERVVEDGKVKFTYDENKDPNKEGVKARKNETQRFMNSYSQADHGTGPRRGRVNVDTLNKGGESDEERDTDAASDDLKRRTDARIEQVGGKYKAKAVKSDWFKDGCSVRDLIRGQRGKTGGDCRAANQTWAANVEVIENKLNFELAKWANEVSLPTGSSVPDDVVDKLSKEILNDEDWLKANIKGGIDPAKISAELERFKEDPALADKSIDVSGIKEVPKDPDDVINNAWDLISKSQEMDQTTIQQLKSNPQLMKSMIKRFDDAKFDLNNIDAAASGRISRDKEEMLKDLKNSWNKIFGADEPKATDVPVAPKTMTTKSVTSTDDEHDQLDKLEKEVQELYGHPVAIRKIFMDNLELHYKGGIQEFLKSFDQAATNSAFLKHRLVLIRSKLKELSGDEAAPGAKPTFGSDVKDGLNEL